MSTKISELRVGDIVAIEQRNSVYKNQAPYTLDWKITKITPTGQIAVEKHRYGLSTLKRRFDKRGAEIGVGQYFPSLEPDHLKAVREVHLWQLLDDVRRALDALRKELNTGAVPATYEEHRQLNKRLAGLRLNYTMAILTAKEKGAFQ